MNEKLNIQNLILLFAERHDITPENAEEFVKTFFALIKEGLEQDKYVKVKGLGTFKIIEVGSRESINVNTGERFEIQGHSKISFTPETALKELINRPFSHFETVVLNENVQFDDMPVEKEGEEDFEVEAEVMLPAGLPRGAEPATEPEKETESSEKADADKGNDVEEMPSQGGSVTGQHTAELPVTGSGRETPLQPEIKTSEKMTKYMLAALVCVLLICAGVVAYLYSPLSENNDGNRLRYTTETEVFAGQTDTLETVRKDSTVLASGTVPADTGKTETNVRKNEQTLPAKKPNIASEPFVADSVSYEIIGTQTEYTIREGETLTRVSLKFYGTKALWPYLVKHNATVLKNPNNVPSGTTIRIPKLAKKR